MAAKTISPEVLTILQEWDQREPTWRAALDAVKDAQGVADRAFYALKQLEGLLCPLVLDAEVFVWVDTTLLRVTRNGYGDINISRITIATVAKPTPTQPAEADEAQPEVQP